MSQNKTEYTIEEYCQAVGGKMVKSCETDTVEAKYPHVHLWNDDTLSYSICTETKAYHQMGQQALYEQEHDL